MGLGILSTVYLRILPRQRQKEQLRVVPQGAVEEGHRGDGAQGRRGASAGRRNGEVR